MEVLYMNNVPSSIVVGIEQQSEMRGPDDDWSGTGDSAKRRKIQNRLHQRAWRKRQAMRRKLDSTAKGVKVDSPSSQQENAKSQITYPDVLEPPDSRWKGLEDVDKTQQALTRFADYANARYMEGSPRTDLLLTLIKFNVFRALMMNDQDLGLDHAFLQCQAISPFYHCQDRTSAALKSSPVNLRPTILQMNVEHHPWIDLLPDPKLRNNILELGDDYDDEPLCHDIIDNPHGGDQSESLIVWGDPRNVASWEIGEDFYRKWAPILQGCYELFRATNYWRGIRGERRLFVNELK